MKTTDLIALLKEASYDIRKLADDISDGVEKSAGEHDFVVDLDELRARARNAGTD